MSTTTATLDLRDIIRGDDWSSVGRITNTGTAAAELVWTWTASLKDDLDEDALLDLSVAFEYPTIQLSLTAAQTATLSSKMYRIPLVLWLPGVTPRRYTYVIFRVRAL